ncbi:Lethal(3)malignant brain tumor-like 3 protein, partial [Anas platyrhynchos]
MEQNVSERIVTIPPPDYDLLNALDWKDGIGTLPGSNIQFFLNEFGMLEILTEAEAEAIKALSASAINASPTSFAPAAVNASAASSADLE